MSDAPGISDQQLTELIGFVRESHGFDFSAYSKSSLKRRLVRIFMLKKISFEQLNRLLITEPAFFQWFLEEITVNVTEMFRDPFFYQALDTQVMSFLADFEHVRVWCAGCSSGEEAYSLAIMLKYAGLEGKSFVYGTDIHTEMLNEARRGIYAMRKLKTYEENYRQCGFPGELLDHFTLMNEAAGIKSEFRQNTLFSAHNLITDSVFNEFQLITCRNVFIYFEAPLQEQILRLFYDSLSPNGFLCLGAKETIRFPDIKNRFRLINSKANIYQKIGYLS